MIGLMPGGLGLLVELDRAEHVAVIGHRDRFHPRGLGVVDQRPDFVGAVEETVLRMNVKMDETHSGPLPLQRTGGECCRPVPLTSELPARVVAAARAGTS